MGGKTIVPQWIIDRQADRHIAFETVRDTDSEGASVAGGPAQPSRRREWDDSGGSAFMRMKIMDAASRCYSFMIL
jgi:hypothetical protein